jgi:hypothetical protein
LNVLLNVLFAIPMSAVVPMSSAPQPDDFQRLSADELKKGIEKRHPAAYYVLAQKLFEAGGRDEAVFWFYAGQLRYRFHLSASPDLPASGDPALFASLTEVIGRPINEFAFGDLPALEATLDKALAWDERADNGMTSKSAHAAEWKDVREGLGKMRDYIKANAEQIRAQRQQNGLENRKP